MSCTVELFPVTKRVFMFLSFTCRLFKDKVKGNSFPLRCFFLVKTGVVFRSNSCHKTCFDIKLKHIRRYYKPKVYVAGSTRSIQRLIISLSISELLLSLSKHTDGSSDVHPSQSVPVNVRKQRCLLPKATDLLSAAGR